MQGCKGKAGEKKGTQRREGAKGRFSNGWLIGFDGSVTIVLLKIVSYCVRFLPRCEIKP